MSKFRYVQAKFVEHNGNAICISCVMESEDIDRLYKYLNDYYHYNEMKNFVPRKPMWEREVAEFLVVTSCKKKSCPYIAQFGDGSDNYACRKGYKKIEDCCNRDFSKKGLGSE